MKENTTQWPYPVKLRFANKSPNPDPVYAKDGDSCFDLRAWIKKSDTKNEDEFGQPIIVLGPGKNVLIHTGLYCELPPYTEIQVRPRSGNALKHHITVVNTPGTVKTA